MESPIWHKSKRKTDLHRLTLALALTSFIGGLTISSAFAAGGDEHNHERNRANEHSRGDYHDEDWRREPYENRDAARYQYRYEHQYQRQYHYAQPVYVPPPVYYEPRQSNGISLFFPLDIRR